MIQVYEEALERLRENMAAHGSTPYWLQTLAEILNMQGATHNEHYHSQRGHDKSKRLNARAQLKESRAINRALNSQVDELDRTSLSDLTTQTDHPPNLANRQRRTKDVVLALSRVYTDLCMFDEARTAVKEDHFSVWKRECRCIRVSCKYE